PSLGNRQQATGNREEIPSLGNRQQATGNREEIPSLGNRQQATGNREEIPLVLENIVMKLMAKNAEDRYQSALGLKYDLEICLHQLKETGKIEVFEIGQMDLCDRFLIPEKLYGRETEVQTLLDAFDRVAGNPQSPIPNPKSKIQNPKSELMLVAGFSGIGKTAVVNEVHKPIVRQQGYFIKGKFDQFNRNIPFSAFVIAFRDFMGQLLGESDAQLATWKTKILQALGENAAVIIEVIPELERIIGQQPPVPELSGNAAQNRFNLLFQKFIEVFTTKEHPLVLFLDDLQWADLASLQLMKLLMNDNGYLLLLGAYRDNEVSATHPFILTVNELQKAQNIVNTIVLKPLAFEDTNHLVADTLNCSTELAQPLTELIDRKTKGNPFFTTQFLKALHDDGCIHFVGGSHSQGEYRNLRYWECNITQVKALSLTDDVVEFMALQLQKLPDETQQVLKLAACIGNQFDLNTLAIVSEQSLTDAATALWKALQEGLILPTDQVYKFFQDKQSETTANAANPNYRFLHDRVQQAAYSLIDADRRQVTHYHIGQLLLENLPQTEQKERLFDIVNQMNMGRHLLDRNTLSEQESKTARLKLAKLNLAAGQKARLSIAYEAAIAYCNIGISLLDREAWNTEDRLMLQLHRNLAESQLSQGSYLALETTTANILNYITVASDRADIQVIRIIQNTLQGKYIEAIGIGLDALAELGIEIDRTQLAEINQREFDAIEQELEHRSIADLIDLPLAIDPSIQATIKLLTAINPTTYIVGDIETFTFVVLKATRLSIECGNIAESILAYANYGLLLGSMHQKYQLGYEFTDFAVQLSYKLNSRSQQSKACLLSGGWTQVWAKHIRGAADINYEGFLAAMDSGEIQFAGYNLFVNIFNRIFQGQKLESIALDLEKYWEFATKYQDETMIVAIAGANLYVRELRSSPDLVTSQQFLSEAKLIDRAQSSQSFMSLCLYYILKMQMACLNANFEEGVYYITEASKLINAILGFTTYSSYFYYASLILLNRYLELSAIEQCETLKQVESNQQRLRGWADSCSENFLHKYFLVEAELQRVLDNKVAAIELYDFAITEARENDYIQEEALANELAAKFYLNWGQEKVAAGYMQSAYYGYTRWGATAKVNDLEQCYPNLQDSILKKAQNFNLLETLATLSEAIPKGIATPHFSIDTLTQTGRSSSSSSVNDALDFAAILKASQSLSSTIQLDDLLHQLTGIILQNSGADRCALILPNAKEEWEVRAIATREKTQLCHDPLQDNPDLPTKLIYYVKNTKEVAIFDNCDTNLSVIDKYLIQSRPQSILCLPILNQGNSIGILYLQNRLTRGVFTRDRIETLQLLTGQAAIALENARLYQQVAAHSQTLEAEVERKTQALQQALQQVRQTQAQLIHTEKMSSLGQMVGGIAHEINNPVNFIKGNIHHTQTYFADLVNLLGLYQQEYPQPTAAIATKSEEIDLDFLIEDISQILSSMQTGSDRIQQIVLSLRNFARLDEADLKTVDIHEGIESTLLIVQHRCQPADKQPEIRVIKDCGTLPNVTCYPSQLNQVFLHIFNNAIDAIRENTTSDTTPEIRIRTRVTESGQVRIQIANTHSFIPEEIQTQIFNPFFTTKPVGQGAGLGLSVSYSIIQKHGGAIEVDSQLGQGTIFTIQLPI
ncbi:MAG: trifunctional serine/threonine-protein kinase/ATP-binding protein/sensor histidine kinase, partial [Microcoleus sp.]